MGKFLVAGTGFERVSIDSIFSAFSFDKTEIDHSGKETAMGYRWAVSKENANEYEFRMMEVIMVKKSPVGESTSSQVVIIDNDKETLRHVQENWNDFINNLIKVKKMEEHERQKMAESSEIFGKRLQPLFSRISASTNKNLLANLSKSLKKALILMAMERYDGDKDVICMVLGINRERLDNEMSLCGLKQERKAA
jgi:broad specificity phosphatase PhoE